MYGVVGKPWIKEVAMWIAAGKSNYKAIITEVIEQLKVERLSNRVF